ncbi:hypothetical protein EI94DRAFT_818035 [Lactarius quietus]|nr:hypothetical protein EI94DRAFT_818035 [Lactarius quietus]
MSMLLSIMLPRNQGHLMGSCYDYPCHHPGLYVGVAAYKLWRSTGDPKVAHDVMSSYHREQYTDIPSLPCRSPTIENETSVNGAELLDPTYLPTASQENEMTQAMDKLTGGHRRWEGESPQYYLRGDVWSARQFLVFLQLSRAAFVPPGQATFPPDPG